MEGERGGGFDEPITPGYKLHHRPDKRFLKLDLTVKTFHIAAYRSRRGGTR